MRRGFIWEAIEKTPGVYDFSLYDRLVKDCRERGLSMTGDYRLPLVALNRLILQSGLKLGIGTFAIYLVVLALFALMPCLAVVSSLAAIIGTFLVSYAYFNIALVYFNDLVINSLLIRDIITGIIKSFLFGTLIAAIACYRGLKVSGGASGVGNATTSSVVTAITTVIGFDTLFNLVYTVFFPT